MRITKDEKIKITKELLEDIVKKLNHNYKIIKDYNENYNEKIAKYMTFYVMYDDGMKDLKKKILDELTNIIRNIDCFVTDDTIIKYYQQLLHDIITTHKRQFQTNYYDPFFCYDNNREFSTPYQYMEKYIIFENNSFHLIDDYEEKIKEFYNKK